MEIMETTINTDVLIAGAGPTGLALACQLIRFGIDFVIIDAKESITPFSKAIGVQARTLEIYEQIDLANALIAQGAKAGKAQFWEGGEMRGEISLADIGHGLSPYPFLLIVEQSKHEQLLHDFLKQHDREILWQTELTDFSQDADGVTAQVKTEEGIKTIRAKYLIGCDGAKSPVRHKLGLEFEGSTFERLFYVADVEINGQLDHDAVQICLAQNTLTAFFPIKGNDHYRIVGTFPQDHDKDEGDIIYEEIERQIVEDTKLHLDITKVNWFSTYKVHSRHVNKFSEGRCFVAGDAAHIHTPAGAQGMNTGIQDGYNLVWKLALVLRGKSGAKLLETYNDERLENARHLLETTDRVFDFGANPDPVIAYLRTHIFPRVAGFILGFDAVKHFVFPLVSQTGINYRHSNLSANTDSTFHIKAGDRMPYFQIENHSIYDILHQPKFHWITFSADQCNVLRDEMQKQYADLIDFHHAPLLPQVSEIFGTDKSFHLLLRPDNYISFIASQISLSDVRAYFNRALGLPSTR
jgi:2-polyprenyl-6-methoxyphenol hydroxylase-like FAD-dependent oxidoreductase